METYKIGSTNYITAGDNKVTALPDGTVELNGKTVTTQEEQLRVINVMIVAMCSLVR